MSHPLRVVVDLAIGALLAVTALVGVLWVHDRTHRWESPRWPSESFVPVGITSHPGAQGTAVCLVAINPQCSRCLTTLWRLHSLWPSHSSGRSLVALIVDTPTRPGAAVLRRLPPVPVWWDRQDVWRRRWGHRLYGEVIEFNAAGRLAGARSGSP